MIASLVIIGSIYIARPAVSNDRGIIGVFDGARGSLCASPDSGAADAPRKLPRYPYINKSWETK